MSLCFDQEKLQQLLIGTLGVLSGVMLKNSADKYAQSEEVREQLKKMGPILFVSGWIYIAYILGADGLDSLQNKKVLVSTLAILGIVGSVMIMMSWKGDPVHAEHMKMLAMVFAGSWLALGVSLGLGEDGSYEDQEKAMYGGMAALLVIGSMLFLLPDQRIRGIVDGPGMPMFTAALGLLALGASKQ